MNFLLALSFLLPILTLANSRALEPRAANSWAGGNLVFLHGLSDSDQDYYINTMATNGAKVVRLWVTYLGQGCQKGSNVATNLTDLETTIGTYNDTVLAALDKTLAKLVAKGMKAVISPHDGNAFGVNYCDIYGLTYASSGCSKSDSAADNFYANKTAQTQYDARLAHILNYKSPSKGIAWSQWSEAILGFDIQNEPFQQSKDKGKNNDPDGWLCGRAQNMKAIIGSSGFKITTGGITGDIRNGASLIQSVLQCDAIDVIAVHGYPPTASTWSSMLPSALSTASQAKKLLFVEEWGTTLGTATDSFDTMVAAINAAGAPWLYWQFTPGPDEVQSQQNNCWTGCCSYYDHNEVSLNKSTRGDVGGGIAGAGKATVGGGESWTGIVG